MQTVAKILGWTIAGVVVVKLFTTASTGSVIANIGNAWSGVLGAITGAGGTQQTNPPATGP